MKKGYLANGLFSVGDRMVNDYIEHRFSVDFNSENLDLYVPQNNEAINDKTSFADSLAIMKTDREELMKSDFLIAVIDGVEIDAGVSAEIGLFASTGKPIYALYTDVRLQGNKNGNKLRALRKDPTENQFMYRNLFVIGLIKEHGEIYHTIEDLISNVSRKELKD